MSDNGGMSGNWKSDIQEWHIIGKREWQTMDDYRQWEWYTIYDYKQWEW